ncbi:hypothetical protein ACLE20_00405 [Rhizobium sp. YIM 134829]|uniref:hypothetical protein n=1 Tax=Rhizobium sp. YIM 134829 TaxID=3390453 RepID=UPI00397D71BA
MADKNFATIGGAESEVEASIAKADLDRQVADLRAEIARLTETVTNIGSGAKAVVQSEAEVLTERLRDRVRDEPVTTLLTIAGVSFVLGLLARR